MNGYFECMQTVTLIPSESTVSLKQYLSLNPKA